MAQFFQDFRDLSPGAFSDGDFSGGTFDVVGGFPQGSALVGNDVQYAPLKYDGATHDLNVQGKIIRAFAGDASDSEVSITVGSDGPAYHQATDENLYALSLFDATLELHRISGGVDSVVASVQVASPADAHEVDLFVRLQGGNVYLKGIFNGVSVVAYTDPSPLTLTGDRAVFAGRSGAGNSGIYAIGVGTNRDFAPYSEESVAAAYDEPVAALTHSFPLEVKDIPDRYMLLAVYFGSSPSVDSVTYGQKTFQLLGSHEFVGGYQLYGLLNPDPGVQDVTINLNDEELVYTAIASCYYGVDQTNPAVNVGSNFGGTTETTAAVGQRAVAFVADGYANKIIFLASAPANARSRNNRNTSSYASGLFDALVEQADPTFTYASDPTAANSPRNFSVALNLVSNDGVDGAVTSAASSSDSWAVSCLSEATLTAAAVASDSLSAIAAVNTSIVAAALASDTPGDQPNAIGQLSASASGNDTLDALASAAAAISAGAAAGESWTVQAQVVVNLLEQGVASDELSRQAQDAINAAVAEQSAASDQFLGAISAIVNLSETATATDGYVAVVAQLGSIASGAIASDTFRTTFGLLRSLQSSAQASDTFSLNFGYLSALQSGALSSDAWALMVRMTAALSEACTADDLLQAKAIATTRVRAAAVASARFAIVNAGIRYLVMGSIILRDALNYRVNQKPALNQSVKIKPGH